MAKHSKTKVLTSHLEMISAYSNNLMFKHPKYLKNNQIRKLILPKEQIYTRMSLLHFTTAINDRIKCNHCGQRCFIHSGAKNSKQK